MDYEIISGARRQENRWDPTQNQQIVPETKEIQKRLFDDSMFKLEHGEEDKNTAESEKPRLVQLFARNESTWGDDYTANSKLREQFRVLRPNKFLLPALSHVIFTSESKQSTETICSTRQSAFAKIKLRHSVG